MKAELIEIAVILFSLGLVAVSTIGLLDTIDKAATANQQCQAFGYSAGHYDKTNGLICEMWKPYTLIKAEAQ